MIITAQVRITRSTHLSRSIDPLHVLAADTGIRDPGRRRHPIPSRPAPLYVLAARRRWNPTIYFPGGRYLSNVSSMPSPEPRQTQQRHSLAAPATPAASGGALPSDALCEILLRLPGKQLCRLRAVCRAWRSLLSAPWFAAAHAARRPEPYVVASYADGVDGLDRDSLVDVLDMSSGRIVRSVAAANASDMVVSVATASASSASALVCVKTIDGGGFWLLNPVTGAVHRLSGRLAPEHAARGFSLRDYGEPVHMFGQVAGAGAGGSGEHKVLRMLRYRWRKCGCDGGDRDDLFEVCTLSSSRSSSSGAQWRGMAQGPPRPFVWNEWTRVVVGGVVYCLSVAAYFAVVNRRADEQDWIVRFDLEAEQWRPSIKGPSGLIDGQHRFYANQVTLASLNGSLVIVHGSTRIMELWFLKDSEEGFWVKQYSVLIERSGHLSPMYPLLVLEDGRIVTVIRSLGLLQIYDPRTGTFASLMMLRHSSRVSVHTGSFLSLSLHGEN